MAKYGSADLTLSIDNSSGGTLTDISQYVDTINGVSVEMITEESHGFGAGRKAVSSVGVGMLEDIEMEGAYDDSAAAPAGLTVGNLGETRTFKSAYGGSKSTTVETLVVKHSTKPGRDGLTKFALTLRPTGTETEA